MTARGQPEAPAVLILSVSSEIGEKLALDYLQRGARVAGTYRKALPASLRSRPNFSALRCDLMSAKAAAAIAKFMRREKFRWNILISCVGQLAPIGPFFGTDFAGWAQALATNGTAQLRALHAAHPFRRKGGVCHVVFFAGGGTNGPFPGYSAYCLGKIALIKMCELLDDENPDLSVFIVGTGWVRTKIHRQTVAAGKRAGANFGKTRNFLEGDLPGTSFADIAAMIRWGVARGKAVAGGRNFSIVHDAWRGGGKRLAASLRGDSDKFKLRRQGSR